MGYGGPHAAYMAVRDALKRSLPGRIVGLSVDSRGAAGLSAGAANPRAAYPPRKGHLQHLHRAGAAGGDRLDVCGLSRPRRPDAHRAPGAPARFRAGGGIEQARLCAALAKLLRYGHGDIRRKAGRDHRARAAPRRSICASAMARSGLPWTRPPRLRRSRRCGARSAASCRTRKSKRARARRCPPN